MRKFNGVLRNLAGIVVAALCLGALSSTLPATAAAQTGDLTIKLNYQRTDANYVDAKAWVWCKDGSGTWGTGVYKATAGVGAPATGTCLNNGAYVSLHSAQSGLEQSSSEFTITGATGVSQLGIIVYKAAGDANCCGTRDAQSANDRTIELVALGTDVVVSDSVATFVTTEYVVPTPSPTDTPTPDPTATDTPTPDPTSPTAPTGVVASPGNNQVSLKWDANQDAISYSVYRDDVLLVGEIAETEYVDATAVNGTAYNYTVTATNGFGESEKSTIVTATPVAPLISPAPPIIKSFSQSKSTKRGVGTVTVSGSNLAGATVKVGTLTATVNKKSSTSTKLVFTIPAKATPTTKGKFTVTVKSKSVTSKSTLKITLK